jgi:hypothetical protein
MKPATNEKLNAKAATHRNLEHNRSTKKYLSSAKIPTKCSSWMNNSEAEDAIGLQGILDGNVVFVCLKRTPTTCALNVRKVH